MAKAERKLDVRAIEAEEDLVIDVQFLIEELIQKRGLSRADLARLTGLSKARISQLLAPEANPTLKNVARIFHALGERLTVECQSERRAKHASSAWESVKEEKVALGFDQERLRALARIRERAGSNDNYLKAKSAAELKEAA